MLCGYAVEDLRVAVAFCRMRAHICFQSSNVGIVLQGDMVFLSWYIWTSDLHRMAKAAKVGPTLPYCKALVPGMALTARIQR